MLRHRNVILLFFILVTVLILSCEQSNTTKHIPNTPTSGKISILADNTFQYILPPQIELFTSIYRNAEVTYQFKGEQECIHDLLNDSCKVIFISRKLSDKELQVFKNNNLIIHQTPVAQSAIALLGKPFNNTGVSIDTLISLLSGRSKYNIVFLKKTNGTVLYCKDSLMKKQPFGKNCFITEDTSEFRKYILDTTHLSPMIGIVDYSIICDDDDPWTRQLKYFHNDTLIIPVRKDTKSPAFYPDQTNIATKDYPIVRTIYCIRRGDNFSLGTGIEVFIAGEKGQILFKKMGLAPIIDRERKIELKPY